MVLSIRICLTLCFLILSSVFSIKLQNVLFPKVGLGRASQNRCLEFDFFTLNSNHKLFAFSIIYVICVGMAEKLRGAMKVILSRVNTETGDPPWNTLPPCAHVSLYLLNVGECQSSVIRLLWSCLSLSQKMRLLWDHSSEYLVSV